MLERENIKQTTLIHPSAVIDETVKIKEGTVIMANAAINAEVQIGRSCIINTSSSIDHECILEDYVHVSPGVHVAGTVSIGKSTWIGISII
jgi:UDP-3-O-[3-hydroxymyristoyl] glucosamine N-acyltransferase